MDFEKFKRFLEARISWLRQIRKKLQTEDDPKELELIETKLEEAIIIQDVMNGNTQIGYYPSVQEIMEAQAK